MRRILFLCLLLIIIAVSGGVCESNAVEWIDCSGEQMKYGKAVAWLNQGTVVAAGLEDPDASVQQYTVLLRMANADDVPEVAEPLPEAVVKGPDGRYSIFYSDLIDAQTAVGIFALDEKVVYAELDQPVYACSEVTFHSWAAPELGFDAFVPFVCGYGNGAAEVAVIDSGLFMHADVRSRVSALGYDYVDSDDDPTNDLFGHGTHVAGIVADCTQGVPVELYPVRVLNASGSGKISNLVNAVYEAVDRGSDIINLSLTSFSESAALDNALLEAVRMGSTVVLAAGNNACNTAEICPAHMMDAGIIVVGSAEGTLDSWERASYSNWGESVDFYAFGSDISSCSRSGGYVMESGTSMAAPHVSAACAMLKVLYPDLSPENIETRLKSVSRNGLLMVLPLVPQTLGFSLSEIFLDTADRIELPLRARPYSAGVSIQYTSSDETIVQIENGALIPKSVGSAVITAECFGFEPSSFIVNVDSVTCTSAELPASLHCLEDEAFANDLSLRHVELPDALISVGTGVFGNCANLSTVRLPESLEEISDGMMNGCEQAVLLVVPGSTSEYSAQNNGWQYIAN